MRNQIKIKICIHEWIICSQKAIKQNFKKQFNRTVNYRFLNKKRREIYKSNKGNDSEQYSKPVENTVLPNGRFINFVPPTDTIFELERHHRRRKGLWLHKLPHPHHYRKIEYFFLQNQIRKQQRNKKKNVYIEVNTKFFLN